jgi:putative endonuclease
MTHLMPPKIYRQRRYRHGQWAEALARLALRLKGYRILAPGYESPLGQIDIIAARGHVLAIVEVKARSNLETALTAISPTQQARILRGTADFLSRHPRYASYIVRFDAMLVLPWRWPLHIENAWQGR